MSIRTSIVAVLLLVCVRTRGQEIPLFTQKLTNSFLYNPSLAGLYNATVTYAYRRNYTQLEGAPEDHYLTMNAPFSKNRFGIGFNTYLEDVSFFRSYYFSFAFAHHIRWKHHAVSAGVSGEYSNTTLNGNSNTFLASGADPALLAYQNGKSTFDVSFGLNYSNRFLSAGVALNKLSSSWIGNDGGNPAKFFSGYAQGMIPARTGRDSFEPYLAYRKYSPDNGIWDVGAFYMIANSFILGGGYRSVDVASMTVAYRFPQRLMIGYSHEVMFGASNGFLGSTNEFVLRYDFLPRTTSVFEECKGDPYGVQINSRYRNVARNPTGKTVKVRKKSRKSRSK